MSGSSSTSSRSPARTRPPGTRVARKRRLSLFTLLRALGYDEENFPGFLDAFVRHFDFLEGQWEKDRELVVTQEEALIEIYKRARPGEPATPDSARNYFNNAFFEPRRYDLSRVGPLQAEPQARPRDRSGSRSSSRSSPASSTCPRPTSRC